jgi:hypothetical protein
MYRLYLVRNGRIAWGRDMDVPAFASVEASGRTLWALHPECDNFEGIEIWHGPSLLYSDQCHADDTRHPVHISSPFETADSTIYRTWRPTIARPLMMRALETA